MVRALARRDFGQNGAEKSSGYSGRLARKKVRTGAEIEEGVKVLYPGLQVRVEVFAVNVLDGALIHVGRSHGADGGGVCCGRGRKVQSSGSAAGELGRGFSMGRRQVC